MQPIQRWFQRRGQGTRLAGLGLVLLAGYMAGQAGRASREVCADVTELPRREAFLAGGERSEIVLRDLLTVLKRIDSRLENIEKTVAGKPAQTKKK